MKYSLRSLMIGITLGCIVLAGRIEYLRRWASYHEREADKIANCIQSTCGLSRGELSAIATMDWSGLRVGMDGGRSAIPNGATQSQSAILFSDEYREFEDHRLKAATYRQAMHYPFSAP
jgi:hypothetical protein